MRDPYTIFSKDRTSGPRRDPVRYSCAAGFNPSSMTGVIDWWQSFVGGAVTNAKITIAGIGVSNWLGQFANNDFAQPINTNRPALIAADVGFNSLQTIDFDGVDNYLRCATIARPAPGTQNTFFYEVWRLNTWVNPDVAMSGGASSMTLQSTAPSPSFRMVNPANANTNAAQVVGQVKRLEKLYTNTTADFLHIGGTTITGTGSGNNAAATWTLGANNGLTQFCDKTLCFVYLGSQLPTLAQLIGLDGYLAALLATAAPFS